MNEEDVKPSRGTERKTGSTASNTVDSRSLFLQQLNKEFQLVGTRDIKEQRYQDWKMLNYQEFELVTEWNNQARELGSVGCEKLLENMKTTNQEWAQYQEYLAHRDEIVQQQQQLLSRQRQKQAESKRNGTARARSKVKTEVDELGHERAAYQAGSEPDHFYTDSRGNGHNRHEASDDDDAADEDEDEDDDNDNDNDNEIDNDNDNDDEPEETEERDEEEVVFADDDANDKDFMLDDDKSEPGKGKKVDLSSERVKIRREIAKMVNKNKHVKAKKRRFTNATITEHTQGEKLEVKVTLKQYHVRQLKRMIAENKRSLEEEAGEGNLKKRKLGAKNANGELITSIDGLPTYGLKMTAKEARAIQRHYDNTYFTIWKDMARKDSAKIARLVQQVQSTRAVNFKKTSSLVAREARKWQVRNFRQLKDFQTKARRGVREMSSFWKKNEREERELKKKAEKEALDQAKREEEERENKRQARKLNFLLTQTELYSHFIGRKIKTDELEGNMADASLKQQNNVEHIDLDKTEGNKTDFQTIDFDNEDDEGLRLKAAQNASNALLETQAKAKEFDANPDEEEELNFQNPTSLGEITIDQPKLLTCTLKEYQLKGLNWLANLYDQGINGILADEMGLGKTVQSISVLANLAERYNIWGPFIVVTPASTLHNWVNEISKFVPDFKILPYWGNGNDRKVLRKFWDRKHLRYGKDAPFHVMITSYQMVVSDAAYLQKMKWQYMILDEAQAIKSSQSSRWKNLLSFHCRNRLLLTGTPIQNSMQELWALLHFIMPSLFDSHDEFSDWFSKDIESHAQSNTQLNQQQLRRLHMILKPFMLRRIKKNVQSELGDKIEIDVMCDLTHRQAKLYQVLKSQVSAAYDAIENAAGNDEASSDQNLVNTVMQFRKVCNHPDLFERADVSSPFSFTDFGKSGSLLREGDLIDVMYSTRNAINFNVPKLIYDELILPNYRNDLGSRNKLLYHTLNVYHPSNSSELCSKLSKLTGFSPNDFNRLVQMNLIKRAIDLAGTDEQQLNYLRILYEDETEMATSHANQYLIENRLQSLLNLGKTTTSGVMDSLLNIKEKVYDEEYMNSWQKAYHPVASAPPVDLQILSSRHFANDKTVELFDPVVSQALSEIHPIIQHEMYVEKHIPISEFPKSELFPKPFNKNFSSNISMPSMDRFITESTKLKKLDELLVDLKKGGHRVLIYFQMTRMMDLMEEYLTYRQYKHIRLDGSSKLEDRRDLVHDWQTKPEIFIFLLSTRAGGLGINLTAADTVIFYDSDWNPTIDSQAMDRAHRLGQTRQVTVYRLLIRGTIEERMRDRAKQKEHVQQVVMEGKTQEKNIQKVIANGNGVLNNNMST